MSAPVACERCGTDYDASLVRWACPVCTLPAPGGDGRRAPLADGQSTLLIVWVATIGNLILLALLAVAVLHVR